MPARRTYPLYMLFSSMHGSWRQLLSAEKQLLDMIESQVLTDSSITPEPRYVMRAFMQPLETVKVLLIGQDPYPTAGVACGLAFAVSPGLKSPQSLKNLMKELATDIPSASHHGDLVRWSNQGVMLLNSALTTRIGEPGAHAKIWREFTKTAIKKLDESLDGKLVCLSLGEHAKQLSSTISLGSTVQAVHPSPLSANRGFFGSRIYSRTNSALEDKSLAPIDWSC